MVNYYEDCELAVNVGANSCAVNSKVSIAHFCFFRSVSLHFSEQNESTKAAAPATIIWVGAVFSVLKGLPQ